MNEKSNMVIVEIGLGSGRVGAACMPSGMYLQLRQLCALGHNNCFLKDEEGRARWARRLINKYKGWDRHGVTIKPLPTMSTRSYQGRWMDFEDSVCEAFGLIHKGYEATGTVKGYIADAVDSEGNLYEIKSHRGEMRVGQVKRA